MPVDAREEAPDLVRVTPARPHGRSRSCGIAVLPHQGDRAYGAHPLLIVLEASKAGPSGRSGATTSFGWRPLQWSRRRSSAKTAGRKEVFAFVGQPFRKMTIEYFDNEAAARSWLGV